MMQASRLLEGVCRPVVASARGHTLAAPPPPTSGSRQKSGATDQHLDYFRATEVQFCPTRAREVIQNAVAETSINGGGGIEDPFGQHTNRDISERNEEDGKYYEVYRSSGSVSLNAVMQSNVPEPFLTRGKAPTHLNMPGGAWSQGYKYLSGQQQRVHQSRQPISLPWPSR